MHTLGREHLAVGFLPIGLISEHLPLLAVEPVRKLDDACHPCASRDHGMDYDEEHLILREGDTVGVLED